MTISNTPFSLRMYQQMEPAKSAKGSLSVSYAELTPMSELIGYDPSLLDRMANYSGGYAPIFGSPELRQKVANYLGVGPDDVIITNGIDDAVPSIYEALLTPADRLSLLVPTYDPLPDRARHAGASIVTAKLECTAHGWVLGAETLAQLFDGVAVCALNVPHNPTGWYPNAAERTALKARAEETDTYVIADEVYSGLAQTPGQELKSLACLSARMITVGSLTKAFGLPGLRIGWIACTDPDVITQIKNVRTYGHCYVSALSEIAAITALSHEGQIIAAKRKLCRQNLDALDSFIQQFPAFSMHRPDHGTVCMAHFSSSGTGFISASDMCQRLLSDRKLILIDNTFFDDTSEWVRFGFGTSRFIDLLPKLAAHLEDAR